MKNGIKKSELPIFEHEKVSEKEKARCERMTSETHDTPMNKDMRNLSVINAVYNFFIGFVEPFLVIFFNKFGSLEEVGISVAILYIFQGIVSLGASGLLSRFGSRRIVLVTQIMEGARVLCFLLVRNVYEVYALQIIGGLIKGFNQPAYMNVYVNVSSDESSKSIGFSASIPTIVYGISALVAGFVIGNFGYAPVFILWGIQEVFYGFFVYYKV